MKGLRLALITLATAALVHVVVTWSIPRLLMAGALGRIAAEAGSVNSLHHADRIDADSRSVVRPAPDIAYSLCLFDLSDGPVAITVPTGKSYTSVSGYARNTDNFFAVNDGDFAGDAISVLLVPEGQGVDRSAATRLVESPSDRGLILIRSVIEDEAQWPKLEARRLGARCESLASPELNPR